MMKRSATAISPDPAGNAAVSIGCGAGFAHDRPEAGRAVAECLAACGGGYLIYETLAERTLAMAQMARLEGRAFGRMEAFLQHSLPACLAGGVKIIGNFGAADPLRAGHAVIALAKDAGLRKPRVGVVLGDNLMRGGALPAWLREHLPSGQDARAAVSANAYIGAEGMVRALQRGADVVVAGRVSDSSLALAALAHARGFAADDWPQLATGALAGHLLECGAQITGGYYADPGDKEVPRPDEPGFPIAEVTPDDITIRKPPGTGGLVSPGTVKEQLLYEIHDPSRYLTPDVTLDISRVQVAPAGRNRVRVSGALGRARPERLRAQICLRDGWTGAAEIFYYGRTAPARAEAACRILRRRMRHRFPEAEFRLDIFGLGMSPLAEYSPRHRPPTDGRPYDLRVRMAARCADKDRLQQMLWEVESLYTNGPAGGGGVTGAIAPHLKQHIALVPRERARARTLLL